MQQSPSPRPPRAAAKRAPKSPKYTDAEWAALRPLIRRCATAAINVGLAALAIEEAANAKPFKVAAYDGARERAAKAHDALRRAHSILGKGLAKLGVAS